MKKIEKLPDINIKNPGEVVAAVVSCLSLRNKIPEFETRTARVADVVLQDGRYNGVNIVTCIASNGNDS
jgi:hypothetical protein